jgi:tRNA threonylcarbamoyl adenosine modification protein (Sua5/YciO/YrdC/YwlC family)
LILQLDGRFPSPRRIERVVALLEDDGVVAIPTDTTYALACLPDRRAAVDRLMALRRLDPKKPLALIFRDIRHVSEHTLLDDAAFRIVRRYLPGPYCFILEANRTLPRITGDNRRRIGVRVPAHAVPQAIVEVANKPLIVTSCIDPDTNETLNDPWETESIFGHGLAAVLDGGDMPGIPTSIIDLTTELPTIIREGLGACTDFRRAG